MSRASPLGRSPLRSHLSSSAPRRLKPNISSAASAQLRHLQEVAAWASAVVPPLGAFLGSHLASTSELLCCPPPSSPHFICQRCESILQVGVNCSVRVRSRKLKKRGTVTKGVTAPINSIIYSCQYCAFENVKPGTSKAYVKTKLSEVAACRKLSEPCQKLNDSMAEKVCQPTKTTNSELISSPKLLTESAGSTGKRAKRKGWQSLKQLAASSADLSPAGSRADFNMRSAKSPLLPQLRLLDSPRVMPAVSQGDFKCVTPISSIEGNFLSRGTGIKTTLQLQQCNAPTENIGCDKNLSFMNTDLARLEQFTVFTAPLMCSIGDTTSHCVPQSEVLDSSGIVATSLWSDAEVVVPISSNEEKPLTNATDVPLEVEQSNAFGLTMNVEDKRRQQKLSFYHSDADAAKLEEFTSVSKCSSQDTKAMFEAQWNSSDAVSQRDLEIVTPSSSIKGLAIDGDKKALNSSFVNPVVDASLPSMFEDDIDQVDRKVLQSPANEKEGVSVLTTDKVIPLNISIEKPVVVDASSPSIFKLDAKMLQSPVHEEVGLSPSRKTRLDDDSWCKIATRQESCKPEADSLRLGNSDGKEISGKMLAEISGSIRKKNNVQILPAGREVKLTTKKKPLFRRVGRQWFTICKSSRTFRWRII